MKPNEVRIGNLVKYEGREFEMHSISNEFPILNTDEFGIGVVGWDDLEGVELTEDWLEAFGAIDDYSTYLIGLKGYYLEIVRYAGQCYVTLIQKYTIDSSSIELNNIEYVHQLQNLIFTLTGEELKLKS